MKVIITAVLVCIIGAAFQVNADIYRPGVDVLADIYRPGVPLLADIYQSASESSIIA
ncbi:hypothetical protein RI844_06710 [Thalassotalea fonticola]|uniref:Uncharacterized protein n=1 Tax=Thalassotalea fonticola TaxID=3065649 RepID=A0ABZ0GT80_9GAMM|nr:hypothetical protein RI844_06710 [Colwelliaceae bacterium S1-1]